MTERVTRRQAALAAAADTPNRSNKESVAINGNGNIQAAADAIADASPRENIFLFWPNIIGK